MHCWKCGHSLDAETIKFRTECDRCGSAQHACVNCRFYSPGAANDCSIRDVERVIDKEARNFCESYQVAVSASTSKTQRADQSPFDGLFKES